MAETACERLAAAWARTDRIFELVSQGASLARPIARRNPFIFYVGHQAHYPYVFAKFRCVANPPSGGTR